MKSNLKISVGIPAYNEGKNIKNLITGLLSQKFTRRKILSEIILVSDGSRDDTVEKIKSVHDKRIVLVDGVSRKGKNKRINEILNIFRGDVLVLLDADIKLNDEKVINALTGDFSGKKYLGLAAGNVQPLPAGSIYEAASNNFIDSLNFIKDRINNGNNVFSVRGPMLALSRAFAKKVYIPEKVPDDRFLYFENIKLGYKFIYKKEAKAWFKSASTLSEQISQWKRFKHDHENLSRVIDREILEGEFFKPLSLKILAMLFQILRNPIAYFVMKYIHLRIALSQSNKVSTKWKIVGSTKSII